MDKREIEEDRNKLLQSTVHTLCDQLKMYFPGQTLGVQCTRTRKKGGSFEFAVVCDPLHNEQTLLCVQVVLAHKLPVLLFLVLHEKLIHEESGDCVADALIELEEQLSITSLFWRPLLNAKL